MPLHDHDVRNALAVARNHPIQISVATASASHGK